MYLIAHRGLLTGPNKLLENNPDHIKKNILIFPQIINEIDVWIHNDIFLGHDKPEYNIDINFLKDNCNNLILHIKNIEFNSDIAIKNLKEITKNCHTFCHENDNFTITSRKWIWLHPKNKLKKNCIIVMPEKYIDIDSKEALKDLSMAKGVCTDYPIKFM